MMGAGGAPGGGNGGGYSQMQDANPGSINDNEAQNRNFNAF
jgi:hypothetical protein